MENNEVNVEEAYQHDYLMEDQIEVLQKLLKTKRPVYIVYTKEKKTVIKFSTDTKLMQNNETDAYLKANKAAEKPFKRTKSTGMDMRNALKFTDKNSDAYKEKAKTKSSKYSVTGVDLRQNPPEWMTIRLDRVIAFDEA